LKNRKEWEAILKFYKIIFPLILLSTALAWAEPGGSGSGKHPAGSIEGMVISESDGESLAGATVALVGRINGAVADTSGHFKIDKLSPGQYSLRVSHIGFEVFQTENIEVKAGETANVNISLTEKAQKLKGITVTPGRFTIMGTEATVTQALTRHELETAPQAGEDIYRAMARLPGVTSEDMSSRFLVRGGDYEEVLATLDGQQIYEPFHLKDMLGGLFSAIDGSAVESMELLTGGFTSQYGDRTSGVLNIKTHPAPTGMRKLSAGISFMNARFMTEGTFAENRGSWLLAGRRGYLDVLLKLAGEGELLDPTYYDLLGKVNYQLNRRNIVSAQFLHAGDRLKVINDEDNDADTIITSYDNSYVWLGLITMVHERVMSRMTLSYSSVAHDRFGQEFWSDQQLVDGRAYDDGGFTAVGFKSDWEFEIGRNSLIMAGFDARRLEADYDYLLLDQVYFADEFGNIYLDRIDTVQAELNPDGNQYGAYLSYRQRIAAPLTVEIGGRYDRHDYSGDENFSPRINASYRAGEKATIRAGWGYYYQSERIDELSPGDRLTEFLPAERAEHRTIGFEQFFESGIVLRIEAYEKKYTDLRPDLRNMFDRLQAFPEYEEDRAVVYRDGMNAKGLEIFLKRENGSKLTWWLSYALARVKDDLDRVRFKDLSNPDGVTVQYDRTFPNPFEQEHTFYLDVSYRPDPRWQFNVAWNYHSGWPYTGVELRSSEQPSGEMIYWLNAGEMLAERYPNYSRIDFRVNRHFDVWSGRMTVYFELINILDRENVRGYSYSLINSDGIFYIEREVEKNFGRLPIFGVSYSLNM